MHLHHLLGSLRLTILINLSNQLWDTRWLCFILIFSWSIIVLNISNSSFLDYNFLIFIRSSFSIRWLLVWLPIRITLLLRNNLTTLLNSTTTRISSVILLTRTLHCFTAIWIFSNQLYLMGLSCLRRTSMITGHSIVTTGHCKILYLYAWFDHTLMSLMSMLISFSLLKVLLKILKILSLTELISYHFISSNSFIS